MIQLRTIVCGWLVGRIIRKTLHNIHCSCSSSSDCRYNFYVIISVEEVLFKDRDLAQTGVRRRRRCISLVFPPPPPPPPCPWPCPGPCPPWGGPVGPLWAFGAVLQPCFGFSADSFRNSRGVGALSWLQHQQAKGESRETREKGYSFIDSVFPFSALCGWEFISVLSSVKVHPLVGSSALTHLSGCVWVNYKGSYSEKQSLHGVLR